MLLRLNGNHKFLCKVSVRHSLTIRVIVTLLPPLVFFGVFFCIASLTFVMAEAAQADLIARTTKATSAAVTAAIENLKIQFTTLVEVKKIPWQICKARGPNHNRMVTGPGSLLQASWC